MGRVQVKLRFQIFLTWFILIGGCTDSFAFSPFPLLFVAIHSFTGVQADVVGYARIVKVVVLLEDERT